MKLYRHKKTNSLMKLKKDNSENIATYYVLNEDLTHQQTSAGFAGDKHKRNKTAVCKKINIIEV